MKLTIIGYHSKFMFERLINLVIHRSYSNRIVLLPFLKRPVPWSRARARTVAPA